MDWAPRPLDERTKTECDDGHKPLFLDERAIGLGIRCLWCGRNAERRVPRSDLAEYMNRSPRQIRELERVQQAAGIA